MTVNVYRDTSISTGHAALFELYTRLISNGWAAVAWSDGTTRTGSAGPASAAALNATSAWFVVNHTASSRKFSAKRGADSNTWEFRYTDGSVSLSAGNATTPDNHASYTQTVFPNGQWYPSSNPNCLAHVVVDDASSSFVMFLRRTPFPGGTTAACSHVFMDALTSPVWAANPDPVVIGANFADANTSPANLIAASNRAWFKRNVGGETWVTSWALENPGNVFGHGTSDAGGIDVEYEARWVSTGTAGVLGKSRIFRGLQPYRTPIVGLDSGATLNRACFGQVTVANDGTALGS